MPPSEPSTPRPPGLLGVVLQIVAKDLRVEWRTREILYTTSFFAVLIIIIFSFAFVREGQPTGPIAGGILWVVIPFAGVLGLGRAFDRERESETHHALLLSPASRAAIYLGKLLGVFIFISASEIVVVPLLLVLFSLEVSSLGVLIVLLLLGTLGFAAVGSLFAAPLMQSRSRDVLLSILLFPIVTPLIVAGAKGTAALLGGPEQLASAFVWLKLMATFDVVFVVLSLWAFGPLTRGD